MHNDLPMEDREATQPDGSAEAPSLEFDSTVLGAPVPVGTFDVTRAAIDEYCRVTADTNPLYTDDRAAEAGPNGGIVAPPAFLLRPRLTEGHDPKVRIRGVYIPPEAIDLYAGERLTIEEPVRPGDRLTATLKVVDVYEKTGRTGPMVFVVREAHFENQHGRRVGTLEYSIIQRGRGAWHPDEG